MCVFAVHLFWVTQQLCGFCQDSGACVAIDCCQLIQRGPDLENEVKMLLCLARHPDSGQEPAGLLEVSAMSCLLCPKQASCSSPVSDTENYSSYTVKSSTRAINTTSLTSKLQQKGGLLFLLCRQGYGYSWNHQGPRFSHIVYIYW